MTQKSSTGHGFHGRWSDILRVGVLPTLAALLALTIILVERAQVDLAADCLHPGICDRIVDTVLHEIGVLWLLPLLVFAIGHALAMRHPPLPPVSRGERLARLLVFLFANGFPSLGWAVLHGGLGAGFLTALTVIGLPAAPIAGVVFAGAFAGVTLAFAAGPPLRTTPWRTWKPILLRYAGSTAIAALVFAGGMLLAPLGVAGKLLTLAIACCIVWTAALSGKGTWGKLIGSSDFRQGVKIIGAAVVALAAASFLMKSNAMTLLPETGSRAGYLQSYIRSFRPSLAKQPVLGGMAYIGPRNLISERTSIARSRTVTETRHKGTEQEINHSHSVEDHFPMWRVSAWQQVSNAATIYIVDDNGGQALDMMCRSFRPGTEFCMLPGDFWAANSGPVSRRLIAEMTGENSFEFDAEVPRAALGTKHDPRTMKEGSNPAEWHRTYCRLNLTNVTAGNFSVHKIIPCGADWKEEASLMRKYVESLFTSTLSVSGARH